MNLSQIRTEELVKELAGLDDHTLALFGETLARFGRDSLAGMFVAITALRETQ